MCCKKVAPETLTALHEHTLPWWQALTLTRHTRHCATCQATLQALGTLDTQLRTLAPIPAEITQPIFLRHRHALLAGSAVCVVLGIGVWRFFTPEISWTDVEKAMGEVKTVQWTRTITRYPEANLSPNAPLVDKVLRAADPALYRAIDTYGFTLAWSTEPERRFALGQSGKNHSYSNNNDVTITDLYDGVIDAQPASPKLLKNLFPSFPAAAFTRSVRFWHGRRVIAFTPNHAFQYTPASGVTRPSHALKDVFFVDPQTHRILGRESYYSGVSEFASQQVDEVTSYDKPISEDFQQRADRTSWERPLTEEESKGLRAFREQYRREQESKLGQPLIEWGFQFSFNTKNLETGYRVAPQEPPLYRISFSLRKTSQSIPDGERVLLTLQKNTDNTFSLAPH